MRTTIVGREPEIRVIADFLDSASQAPAGLLIEGEPGIGKTTLWQAAAEMAAERGCHVLLTRPASAEAVLAYSALADMVGGIADAAWTKVPEPQRIAMDRVLLRSGSGDSVTDPRAVAAGFLSVVRLLQETSTVLLAIDDVQWLDSSSMGVMAFAARRLVGQVGIIATLRTGSDYPAATDWLDLPKHAQIRRISLRPMSLGGLRTAVSAHMGQSVPRATAVRIHELSQGNPFYALELARVMDTPHPKSSVLLPDSLSKLVSARIESLNPEVLEALLAAACASAPTVDLVAHATGNDPAYTLSLLAAAEDNGLVRVEGQRLFFSHPILARGVYAQASPSVRREMHRVLARIVAEPELQARHLALAVGWADPQTLARLNEAADSAHKRGAPAAAAELLELAVRLGGGTAVQQIRLAGYHFDAGDVMSAREVLEETIAELQPGPLRAQALSLLGPVRIFSDSFVEGVEAFERSSAEASYELRSHVQVALLLPLFIIGEIATARSRANDAVVDAERLGDQLLLSQALSLRAFLDFSSGNGVDEASLQAALEMEDRQLATNPRAGFELIVRSRTIHAILLGWSGRLDSAYEEMRNLRQHYVDEGLEFHLMFVIYYSVQVDIWRGNFAEANRLVEHGMESVGALGGDVGTGAALTWRAALAAYAGNEAQVRRDVPQALTAMKRCGARIFERWPIAIAGFLEVSLGNYEAALTTLDPLLSTFDPQATEICLAEFIPDAVEAMVHLALLDDAEPLVDALERNGRRLDRAWMLAVGGRCRGMLLAARGDVDGALAAAESAIAAHDRLPMPFERARTESFAGQLHRRRGYRDAASRLLRTALEKFECLETPLWTQRARAELARAEVSSRGTSGLTPAEQQVAELAASGMKNRDVAAALFISPKTVEANLARIYRKLGIHSRAELGRLMAGEDA